MAAKEGDSGPGWKVKSYKMQGGGKVLYCEYDGVFRLKPQTSEFHSCGTSKRSNKYLTSNSLKCSNRGVQLLDYTKSRRQKWLITPAGGSGRSVFNIVEDKGDSCKRVYLSAPVSPSSFDDYASTAGPVPLELSKDMSWTWNIRGQGGLDDIDCLQVDLLSATQNTFINVNQKCTEFMYDSDIGDWELIPANAA